MALCKFSQEIKYRVIPLPQWNIHGKRNVVSLISACFAFLWVLPAGRPREGLHSYPCNSAEAISTVIFQNTREPLQLDAGGRSLGLGPGTLPARGRVAVTQIKIRILYMSKLVEVERKKICRINYYPFLVFAFPSVRV